MNLMHKPLSESEIKKLVGNKIEITTYSRLKNRRSLFTSKPNIMLLIESKYMYGHWVIIMNYPNKIEFFNPYGTFPDNELNYINLHFKAQNQMDKRYLTSLLVRSGKKIYYSQYRLQSKKNNTQTCGYWCLVRLHYKHLNEHQFANMFKGAKNKDLLMLQMFKEIYL
jgi:hypothetical protein